MKKILLPLVLSSFFIPLTAHAAAIEIASTSGGVGVTNGSSNFTAVANHTSPIGVSGSFVDQWDITNPAGAFVKLVTTNSFSAFNIQYSVDNGANYIPYSPAQNGSMFSVSPVLLNAFNAASPLKVIFSGTVNGSIASSYDLTVFTSAGGTPPPSAVPVPAAVWLFGSALMGLVSASRRKKSIA